jgi:pimeloyl-ACP methyl ester carboxylesterase
MRFATTNDGVRLHYEETGSGIPVIFVHEFAGDHRAWEAQMRHFGQRYRAITYAARGYPPSDVPHAVEVFSGAGGGRLRRGAGHLGSTRPMLWVRWASSLRCILVSATPPALSLCRRMRLWRGERPAR